MTPVNRIRMRKNPVNVSTPQGYVDFYADAEGNLVRELPDGVVTPVGGGVGPVIDTTDFPYGQFQVVGSGDSAFKITRTDSRVGTVSVTFVLPEEESSGFINQTVIGPDTNSTLELEIIVATTAEGQINWTAGEFVEVFNEISFDAGFGLVASTDGGSGTIQPGDPFSLVNTSPATTVGQFVRYLSEGSDPRMFVLSQLNPVAHIEVGITQELIQTALNEKQPSNPALTAYANAANATARRELIGALGTADLQPLTLTNPPVSSRLVLMAGTSNVLDATGSTAVMLGNNLELPLTVATNHAFFADAGGQNEVLWEGQWNIVLNGSLAFYSLEDVPHPRLVDEWTPVGDAGGDMRVYDLALDLLPDRIVEIDGMIDPLDAPIPAVTLTSSDVITYGHSANLYELRFVDTYWQIYDVVNDQVAYSADWVSNAPWDHDWSGSAVNSYSGVLGFAPSVGPVISAPSAPRSAGDLSTVTGDSEIYEATMTWPAVRWEAQSDLHVPRAFPAAFAASLAAWLTDSVAKTFAGVANFLNHLNVSGNLTVTGSTATGPLVANTSARLLGAPAVPATSDSLVTSAQANGQYLTHALAFSQAYRMWSWSTPSTTGTTTGGAVEGLASQLTLITTTAAGAVARAVLQPWIGGLSKDWGRRIDWTAFRGMSFRVSNEFMGSANANAVAMISLGKTPSDGVGDLTRRGIGLRLVGTGSNAAALWGQCHDGTTLTHINLGVTLGSNHAQATVLITSNGAGGLTWNINGVVRGTTSLGSTSSTSEEVMLVAELTGAGNVTRVAISPITTYVP